jgi:hypothetical protein
MSDEDHPGDVCPHSECVEVPLLLPAWQAEALEELAYERGLTVGALARSLLRDFVRSNRPGAA